MVLNFSLTTQKYTRIMGASRLIGEDFFVYQKLLIILSKSLFQLRKLKNDVLIKTHTTQIENNVLLIQNRF